MASSARQRARPNAARSGDGETTKARPPPRQAAEAAVATATAAANGDLQADQKPATFTEVMYDAFTRQFASTNPTQLFTLSWPGTVLDYDRMSWTDGEETGGNMPERALVRSSQVLDQFIPAAPLTQPDGTRVSDRYQQALSQYGPKPNAALLQLQAIIRERLQVQVTREVDGEERTFSLSGWFDYLFGRWATAKTVWGDKQLEMQTYFKDQYRDSPNRDAWWDAYLQWYGNNAEGYIARINGKWQQLVAEFPLTEWEDAIAILDTKDAAGLEEAREILRNSIRPVPYQEGIDYVPTQGVPYDWPLELEPVTKFLDLLADPEAQRMALETALTQLEQEVFNWTAIVPQIDDDQITADVAALSRARNDFSSKQTGLIRQYGANLVEAVQIFADIMEARQINLWDLADPEGTKVADDVNGIAGDLAKAAGLNYTNVDWRQVKEIAEKIGKGQDALVTAQQALIDSGASLADAADRFLADRVRSSSFPWLGAYITQLRSKLDAVRRAVEDHGSAANVWAKYRSTAPEAARDVDPNAAADFGADSYPSPLDSPANDRWTLVKTTVSTSQLRADNRMNTSFSDMQWGVDLFLGSAGGSYEQSGGSFASSFMQQDTEIQIGFLATKVLIERPWMKPELFAQTRGMFRTTEARVSPDRQLTAEELKAPGAEKLIQDLLENYTLPCYPVALLLVKDVTVRVQVKFDQVDQLRDYAKSVKSQGGGFLCFSISRTESSESSSESTNEFCMAGQFVARAPAPQIVGYWVQLMPPDRSQLLTPAEASQIAQSLGFVSKLQAAHQSGEVETGPARRMIDAGL